MASLFNNSRLYGRRPPDSHTLPSSNDSFVKMIFQRLLWISRITYNVIQTILLYPIHLINTTVKMALPPITSKSTHTHDPSCSCQYFTASEESLYVTSGRRRRRSTKSRRRRSCVQRKSISSSSSLNNNNENCIWKEKYLTAMEINKTLKEQLLHEKESREIVQKVYAESIARLELELTQAINNSLAQHMESDGIYVTSSPDSHFSELSQSQFTRIPSPMPALRSYIPLLDDCGCSNPLSSSSSISPGHNPSESYFPNMGNVDTHSADSNLSPSSFDSLRLVCDPYEPHHDVSTSPDPIQKQEILTFDGGASQAIENDEDEEDVTVEDSIDFDSLAEQRIQNSLVSQVTLPSLILDLEDLSLKTNATNQDCCRVVLKGLLAKLAVENHLGSPKHIHALFERFSRLFVHFSFDDEDEDKNKSASDNDNHSTALSSSLLIWLELFCLEASPRYTSHLILLKSFAELELVDSSDVFHWIDSTPPNSVVHDTENDFRKFALPFAIALRDEEFEKEEDTALDPSELESTEGDDEEEDASDSADPWIASTDNDEEDEQQRHHNYRVSFQGDSNNGSRRPSTTTVSFALSCNSDNRSRKKSWSCRVEDMVDIVFADESASTDDSDISDNDEDDDEQSELSDSDEEGEDDDNSDASDNDTDPTPTRKPRAVIPDGVDSGCFIDSEDEQHGTHQDQNKAPQHVKRRVNIHEGPRHHQQRPCM